MFSITEFYIFLMIYAPTSTEYLTVPYLRNLKNVHQKHYPILFSKTVSSSECLSFLKDNKLLYIINDKSINKNNIELNIVIQACDLQINTELHIAFHTWILKKNYPEMHFIPTFNNFDVSATFSAGIYPLESKISELPDGDVKCVSFGNNTRHVKQGIGLNKLTSCYSKIHNIGNTLKMDPPNSCNFMMIDNLTPINKFISVITNPISYTKTETTWVTKNIGMTAVTLHVVVFSNVSNNIDVKNVLEYLKFHYGTLNL